MTRKVPIVATIVVAVAVAILIALGVWQLQRAAWKEQLLASYADAAAMPEIAFPTAPFAGDPPLFRKAHGTCLKVASWSAVAGENRKGETGYAHLAHCMTGAEGPGMTVGAGWSMDPAAKSAWTGGTVTGIIGSDRKTRMRLVSTEGLGGLQASAPPSVATASPVSPGQHRGYAATWVVFAAAALVIYVLALRKRWAGEGAK